MFNTINNLMEQLGPKDERWSELMGLRSRAQLLEEQLGDTMVPFRYVLEEMMILEDLDELMEALCQCDQ